MSELFCEVSPKNQTIIPFHFSIEKIILFFLHLTFNLDFLYCLTNYHAGTWKTFIKRFCHYQNINISLVSWLS